MFLMVNDNILKMKDVEVKEENDKTKHIFN